MSALPEYITAMHIEEYEIAYLIEVLEKRGITEFDMDDLIEVIQETHKWDFPQIHMKRIVYMANGEEL